MLSSTHMSVATQPGHIEMTMILSSFSALASTAVSARTELVSMEALPAAS